MSTMQETDTQIPAKQRPLKRKLTTAAMVAGLTLTSLMGIAAPADAHARCDGANHRDWHTIAFHYDYHNFVRYEYSWHYHFWSGSNHQHKHVRFTNANHGTSYFEANC